MIRRRWSPDGKRLLYLSVSDGSPQIHVRWMDSGQVARATRLPKPPGAMDWSPDGRWILFDMSVADETKPFAEMPAKPEGAEWAKPPKTIRRMIYRTDEEGYLEEEHRHVFLVPADGGAPRQLTRGPHDHQGPYRWTPDGGAVVFSANLYDDWEYQPLNSEIHSLTIPGGVLTTLTHRNGPDRSPAVSPDGRQIAYLGFDDRYQATR